MEVQVTHHLTPRADLGLYNMTELFFFPPIFHFSKPRVRGLLPLSMGCVMTTDTFLPHHMPAVGSPYLIFPGHAVKPIPSGRASGLFWIGGYYSYCPRTPSWKGEFLGQQRSPPCSLETLMLGMAGPSAGLSLSHLSS